MRSKTEIKALADQLVHSHYELMDTLIEMRKQKGISQATVGERMGISQPAVASFEAEESNPTLSSIRRYALAVGARLEHIVIDDEPGFSTNVRAGTL